MIETIYNDPVFLRCETIFSRIDYLSAFFFGKPYLTNPQGEGAQAVIDQAPLYRLDGFDCVTFVNNVLALALSHDEDSFRKKLLAINYYHATPTFENRFHFMSVDWNPENQKNNIVRDVTREIADENESPIFALAEGEIDRPGWFLKRAESESESGAAYLRDVAKAVHSEFSALPYLPLTQLFDDNKLPRDHLFNQIPHASVIEIVRPNWQLKEKIGTNLHVSHVGFAIRKVSGELYFRHASSEQKCVVEVLLSDYLKNYLDSPTVKGINVQGLVSVKNELSGFAHDHLPRVDDGFF